MGLVTRGARNAFRNSIRSVSITLILALSIALALVMLLSMKGAQSQIDVVKGEIGNTITVTPAGLRGFEGGGDPLTMEDLKTVQALDHVRAATGTIVERVRTEGAAAFGPNAAGSATTSLVSPIEPGALGQRFGGGGGGNGPGVFAGGQLPEGFTLPTTFTGSTDPLHPRTLGVDQLAITSGSPISGTETGNVALVGQDLAVKNKLSVGSTFSAYGKTLTVAGVFSTGNTFTDAGVITSLATLQSLSGRTGVTTIAVTVDSIDHVTTATHAIEGALGSRADVVSDQTNASGTIDSLDNVKTIALYSLVGALVAGSIIIFLSMLMIVRERRREIGVLKAIGGSNAKISLQFVIEALTLTLMGAVLGVLAGIALSGPVLDVLVQTSDSTPQAQTIVGPGGRRIEVPAGVRLPGQGGRGAAGGPTQVRIGQGLGRGVTRFDDALDNVQAAVGFDIVLYGLLAAGLIAVVGAALPSWFIAKIRPAEVMRTE